MGVFYSRFLESVEDDVEDAIQTPDDVGVDLDAIEDAIVGNDGIEAHRDEIEAAEEGVVGDPLEEAAVIMYESEYNFNQLMKCIGIAELNEMAAGRDFILEANSANAGAFWEKVKKMFENMFVSITKVFQNVVSKMTTMVPGDKKFVEKNESIIRMGANDSNYVFKGCYDFSRLRTPYNKKNCKLRDKFDAAIKNPNWTKEGDKSISNAAIIADVAPFSMDVSDAKEFVSKLQQVIFVEKEYSSKDATVVINILKNDDDIKNIRDAYAELKKQYAELFKHLKQMKASFDKKTQDGARGNNICIAYISAYKYEKNLQHAHFTTMLKAHKTARVQARRMAVKWYNEGQKYSKGNKIKVNENTFINIDII